MDRVIDDETVKKIAAALDAILNGDKLRGEREMGFILFVFPFNKPMKVCDLITNGATTDNVKEFLEEYLVVIKEGFQHGL
jgi:hypothetical protein